MNRHHILKVAIFAMLSINFIYPEAGQAQAGNALTRSSLFKKASKGALILGSSAMIIFASPLLEKQPTLSKQEITLPKQSATQDFDHFRTAVLELDPSMLAQTVQQTDVNKALFSDGSTALHYAVANGSFQSEQGKLQVVDILMAHGADPYFKNNLGVSVIEQLAASQPHDKQAKMAMSAILGRYVHGINAADDAGVRPIEYAIRYAAKGNGLWLARELVAAGADISVLPTSEYLNDTLTYLTDKDKRQNLEDAAILITDVDQFLALIDAAGNRGRIVDIMGDYLFAIAISHNNFSVAEVLVDLGVNPNDHPYRKTLDESTRIHQLELPEDDGEYVEWLLGVGADPNHIAANGLNFLHLAAWHGNVAEVEVLLANGANPFILCSSRGKTALHYAIGASGDSYPIQVFELVNTLLAHNSSGVNLAEIRDYAGLSAYSIATQYVIESFSNDFSRRSDFIINAATAAILLNNMEQSKDPQGRTASYWANLSGLARIKNLVKQENSYLSGEELASFSAYLRDQTPHWDRLEDKQADDQAEQASTPGE